MVDLEIKDIFNTCNKTRRFGVNCEILYIVVHYTACLASASLVERAMRKTGVSTHYIIDRESVLHCVDENKNFAWHCGVKEGSKAYCSARNRNSIGIDLCECKVNKKTRSVSDTDWYFEDAVIDKSSELIARLIKEHNLCIENVVRHYDVTRKACPRPFVGDDINSVYGKSGNEMWSEFLKLIQEKLLLIV